MILRGRSLIALLSLLCLMGLTACAGNPGNSSMTSTTTTTTQTNMIHTSTPTTTQNSKKMMPAPTHTKMPENNQQKGQNQNPTSSTMMGNNTASSTTTNPTTPSTNMNNDTMSNAPTNTQMNNQNSQTNTTPQTGSTSSASNNQAPASPTYIKILQTNIKGQVMQILTTGTGMVLYYRASDVPPNAVCSGACAQAWPPLLSQGQIITSNTVTSGQFTVQQTSNGKQVEYNGHPLYTYANDATAGQASGQGVGNVWSTVSVTTQAFHW